jgi:hypothetical protein
MWGRRTAPRHGFHVVPPSDAFIAVKNSFLPNHRHAAHALGIVAFVAFFVTGLRGPAAASDLGCQVPAIRWANSSASLLKDPKTGSTIVGTVSTGAMLAVLPIKGAEADGKFIFVKPIGVHSQRAGWISLAATGSCLSDSQLSERGWSSIAVSGMPILIQRLPEAQRNDWRLLNEAIQAAERQGVAVPDAYVARAELWTVAGDTSKAVEDFRKAADLAVAAGRSPLEQSAYLRLLRDALERLDKAPKPAEGARANDYVAAQTHFGVGCRLFWSHAVADAERKFDDAIALNPKEPIYWYYRALARRQNGDLHRAAHDALIGCFLERSRYVRDAEIGRALQRVQGDDRAWLETYRLGDPSQRLLQLELSSLTASSRARP